MLSHTKLIYVPVEKTFAVTAGVSWAVVRFELFCLGQCRGRGVMWEDNTAAVRETLPSSQTGLGGVGWKFSLKDIAESIIPLF